MFVLFFLQQYILAKVKVDPSIVQLVYIVVWQTVSSCGVCAAVLGCGECENLLSFARTDF